MQALKLEAQYGLRWIMRGWSMLRRQPLSFIALLLLFWMVLLCASVVIGWVAQGVGTLLPFLSVDVLAVIGSLMFAALTPALTVGFLQACRVAESGRKVHPFLLFAPFRGERRTLLRLLALGLIQMAALVVILLATGGTNALRGDPSPVAQTSADPKPAATASTKAQSPDANPQDEEEIRQRAAELTAEGLAYLPVALVMWYAPMLVAWHRVPVGKALFFSVVGVWRNRAAFLVYGVAWIVIWMTASIAIALVGVVVGVGNLTAFLVAPLAMLLLTCMYCSMYQSYATVYVETPAVESPVP